MSTETDQTLFSNVLEMNRNFLNAKWLLLATVVFGATIYPFMYTFSWKMERRNKKKTK